MSVVTLTLMIMIMTNKIIMSDMTNMTIINMTPGNKQAACGRYLEQVGHEPLVDSQVMMDIIMKIVMIIFILNN